MSSILLVDDDKAFRTILHNTLEHAGYEVQDAGNGNVALERYRQQANDLVLIDLLMPEKPGLETITELRAINPSVRIIAMSGGDRVGPRSLLDLAEKIGAKCTLAKPFAPGELLAAVRQVLSEPAASAGPTASVEIISEPTAVL